MAIIPRSSYYDKHYRQSAALIRARRPYLLKNIITGTAIFGFAVGVCRSTPDAFTIHAVAQDDFDDVPMPDVPAQPARTPNVGTVSTTSAPIGR
ncbi:MAG: hypothetical protein M1832_002062 [Thelocarpon impressellum]|nr:MAG: hypothetical protein M1832_002062 [Thelocarpon impressellum]